MVLPQGSFAMTAGVSSRLNIPYVSGPAVPDKQKLDLYLPEGEHSFPVVIFFHGGYWSYGDRSQYTRLGELLASKGVGVVIPSYRLAPAYRFPVQAEDAAAAFAWTAKNIAQYQGDPKRIYLMGHSAGGHLAALLALQDSYLQKYDLTPRQIRGVIGLSGAYSITGPESVFGSSPADWKSASPLSHVHSGAPKFLLVYSERDYPSLPGQAREMDAALREAGVSSDLVYIPGEDHVSELFALLKPTNPATKAILKFVQ